jgi:hypothetical protein
MATPTLHLQMLKADCSFQEKDTVCSVKTISHITGDDKIARVVVTLAKQGKQEDKIYFYEFKEPAGWGIVTSDNSKVKIYNPDDWTFYCGETDTKYLCSGGFTKKPVFKRLPQKIKIGTVTRCVYEGTRGCKYVKLHNKFVSLKLALKQNKNT